MICGDWVTENYSKEQERQSRPQEKKSEAKNGGKVLPGFPITSKFLILIIYHGVSIHAFRYHETLLVPNNINFLH